MKSLTDWNQPQLRAAAVEFTLQQCGKRPRSGGEAIAVWMGKLECCARAFGLTGTADLEAWCRDPDYKPAEDYSHLPEDAAPHHRAESDSVEDDAAIIEKAAAEIPAPDVPAGALPSVTDLIASLIDDEASALTIAERAEIAEALNQGKDLTAQQRRALSVLLLSAEAASKADVVRAFLDLVIPHGSELEQVWEVTESRFSLRAGEVYEHRECAPAIPGFRLLGRTLLCVLSAAGCLLRALPYARACASQRTARGCSVKYRRLIPCAKFSKDLPVKNLCLLADAVRGGERTGAGWGELWDESKQIVSYRRKQLMERIARRSGAKSLLRAPGMRHKPQSNKGSTKKT